MFELLALVGIGAAGMGGMWVKTRRRTNKGNTRVVVSKFDDAAQEVAASQARWYDLQIETPIVAGGLDGADRTSIERAEAKARERSRELYEAWLPVSDVKGDDVASYNDGSRKTVAEHKRAALSLVHTFNRDLDALEQLLDEHRA